MSGNQGKRNSHRRYAGKAKGQMWARARGWAAPRNSWRGAGARRLSFPGVGSRHQIYRLGSIRSARSLPSSSPSCCVDMRSRRCACLSREPVRQGETRLRDGEAGGRAGPPRRGQAARWLETKDQSEGERGHRVKRGWLKQGEAQGKGVSQGTPPRFVYSCLLSRPP